MWLTGWNYRKKITIDHTKVGADLSYFPTLIKLINDASIGAYALANGYDIRITDYTGTTTLAYERESFAIAGGLCNAFIWVKVPALSSSVDTVLYVYYGKSDATDGQNKTAVWDDGGSNNFKMVQHMNQDPSGTAPQMIDSTQYANNGTSGGTMTSDDLVTGQIDGATDFDGVDDYVDAGNGSSLNITDAIAISLWVYPTYTGANEQLIYYKGGPGFGSTGIRIGTKNGTIRAHYTDGANDMAIAPAGFTTYNINQRYHIVISGSKGDSMRAYVNGSLLASNSFVNGILNSNTDVCLGSRQGTFPFAGSLDEVRISNTARSAEWIATEYNNQNSPSTFYLIGAETFGSAAKIGTGSYKMMIDPTKSNKLIIGL